MSGGTPCGTPGPPEGNTSRRSPFSGGFEEPMMSQSWNLSSGSNESQPASARAQVNAAMVTKRRITLLTSCPSGLDVSSGLGFRAGERHQHFDALAGAGRRFGIGRDQVEPALRRSTVAGTPGGEREQLARDVAERPVRRGQWLEPARQ